MSIKLLVEEFFMHLKINDEHHLACLTLQEYSKNIYDVTFERYGHETLKLVRDFEKDLSRFNKVTLIL